VKPPADERTLDLLFREARSQNGWRDEQLPDGMLEALWDLVKLGPTSANTEPMRIAWCVTHEARRKLAACCSAQNAPKVLAAPATAIVGYDLQFYEHLPDLFPHADARPWFTGSDATIQATAMRNGTLQGAYLILAARALGLDAGPMSGFDEARVERLFFAETSIKVNFICSIGCGDPAKVMKRLPRLSFAQANIVL
jgi:3-hydroxypropanoate dehydrogenase